MKRRIDKLGDYGLQVKRLIVCGQRCNQMFSLKEEWIDRKKWLIVFPDAFMKSNKDHTLPYGSLMESLLSTFPRITNQSKGEEATRRTVWRGELYPP